MIFEKVQNMIAEKTGFDKNKIAMDSNILDDIGLDSLDIVELIMAAEEEWDIIVEDEDVMSFRTVADVVKYVENKIA